MMDLILKEFLRVQLRHNYFIDDLSPYFEVYPTQPSLKRMKSFHIFRKLLTNQFSLSINAGNNKASILDDLRDLGDLYFLLVNKHEYLVNYTNLRLIDRMVEILYLSTSVGEYQLQQTNPVGNSHVLNLRPFKFSVELSGAEHVEIKSDTQDTLLEFDTSDSLAGNLPINLFAFGDGCYELWIDGKFDSRFFATGMDFPQGCIGVLHVSGNDVCEMLERSEDGIALSSIEFDSKECYWEYEIALTEQRKIEIHSLQIDGKDVLEFSDPVKTKMADKIDLTVFTSKTPKKLVGKLETAMELRVKYSNLHADRRSELIQKLPVPDIKRVKTRTLEVGTKINVAPTLIYI